ncbi:MAG: DUF6159 family protein [Planctomycetota bacterium]
MFGSFSRSYQLVTHSWAVLRQDKEIMIFPVLSALASLLVAASFIVPVIVFGVNQPQAPAGQPQDSKVHIEAAWYAYSFLFYLVSYFITIFFNVGVMHCAAKRMDGGDPTVADGFRGAFANVGPIFMWALVAATVGMVLRVISEKSGLVGKIITSLLGLAWSLLTYFAVPVMIFEGAGVGRAITRSGELFKKTWGEAVVGEGGMGLFFGMLFMIGLLPIGFAIYLGSQGALGIPVAVMIGGAVLFYWIALAVVSAALQGVFHVALYRYASTGQVAGGYTEDMIAGHWRPKG